MSMRFSLAMDFDRPAPPPLVSTDVNASTSSLPRPVPTISPPGSSNTLERPVSDFALFQQMLVEVMRDPRVLAAVLPGPSPSAYGKFPKKYIRWLANHYLLAGEEAHRWWLTPRAVVTATSAVHVLQSACHKSA